MRSSREKSKVQKFSYTEYFLSMGRVASGLALPIFKSKLAKAVVIELSEA